MITSILFKFSLENIEVYELDSMINIIKYIYTLNVLCLFWGELILTNLNIVAVLEIRLNCFEVKRKKSMIIFLIFIN